MLVLGAGPGGYSAAFRSADLGKKTVLVERYATLGGVCLNVGCIPSKALLHVAAVMDEASHFADIGIDFGKPSLDLDKLRAHKSKVVGKLTGGLNTMAKARKVTVLRGMGTFVGPHRLQVDITTRRRARKQWREKSGALCESDHRCRLAIGKAPVYSRRSAHRRFDRRARTQSNTEAHAGDRWRHHWA